MLRQQPAGPAAQAIAALLDGFHAQRRLRVWSLIVTLYGDAIVPRGGSLWLGSLTDIMALFRIDAGHVRTAMSRLTADGWIEREKAGRNSYYRLSGRERGSFIAATQRIYFAHEPAFDGHLHLALLGPGVDDRSAVRPGLEQAGFAPLTPSVYVALADPPPSLAETEGLFLIRTNPGDDLRGLAAAAWKLAPLADAYRTFIARFEPLARALDQAKALSDADALVARVLLIHEFRRIVLRDPGLPAALLAADWPSSEARALAARLYRALAPGSEAYLDAHAEDRDGPLPPPDTAFRARFA